MTDYQYDVNIRSDASFVKEYIENAANSEESVMLITDGAYAGEDSSSSRRLPISEAARIVIAFAGPIPL